MKLTFSPCVLLTTLTLSLVGCGGGYTRNEGPSSSTPSTPSTPVNTDNAAPPTGSCRLNQLLAITDIEATGALVNGSQGSFAADGDLETVWLSDSTNASVTFDLSKPHQLNEVRIAWNDGENQEFQFSLEGSANGTDFYDVALNQQTSGNIDLPETVAFDPLNIRYLKVSTNFASATNSGINEVLLFGCAIDGEKVINSSAFTIAELDLNPNLPPSGNFDLLTWGLDNPEDNDNNGRSDRIQERELAGGFTNEYFYTADDGGMVFRSPLYGPKTSTNTSYTRSELREMLRRGNSSISTQGPNLNNWVLGYQPETSSPVGGRNGHLSATLAINDVSTTGENYQIGRVIIGQIHAGDDEPIRLYYRIRPGHEFGYVYFAHEINGGDDTVRMVYGPEYSNQNNQPNFSSAPSVGIRLNEVFSYEIIQEGARIDVLVRKGGLNDPIVAHQYVDMDELNSGYDVPGEWMYFKAGAYSGNNSANQGEFDQVTFYVLKNEHGSGG